MEGGLEVGGVVLWMCRGEEGGNVIAFVVYYLANGVKEAETGFPLRNHFQ